MKSLAIIFLLFLSLPIFAKKATIVIDPGHGGNDAGAIAGLEGHVLKEKDIALKIAKRVQRKLFEEYNIYLTRSSDQYRSLKQRAHLAETVKADLFISIHLNSSEGNDFQGFETYYLDNRDNKALSKLEQDENQTSKWDEVNQIVMDIVINKTVDSSKAFSLKIHEAIAKELKPLKMRDRGVKAGLFYVLAFSKRPGVLLEAGFISNPEDATKLIASDFHEKYADGIVQGIRAYFLDK